MKELSGLEQSIAYRMTFFRSTVVIISVDVCLSILLYNGNRVRRDRHYKFGQKEI